MMINTKQTGFTLIEIAIVLIIVSVLLGYTVAMFPIQRELKQYRSADAEMDEIIDELIAYAQVNGRLPCPDSTGDAVENSGALGGCAAWFGNLPAKTMGLDGKYSVGVMVDPWGGAYRYQVSAINSAANGGDFVMANDMRAVGIANLAPDLAVCDTDPAMIDLDLLADGADGDGDTTNDEDSDEHIACDAGSLISNSLVAVILSTGKDRGNIASNFQAENLDNSATDAVFVKSTKSDVAGAEYDDIVKWLSLNKLISKMIEADQLP
ncbi:MAG: type II secretion system protein [Gammaproteobacteria bacterium]|nr:type II secretion system protein [Gammaproteobacteria bacterium]